MTLPKHKTATGIPLLILFGAIILHDMLTAFANISGLPDRSVYNQMLIIFNVAVIASGVMIAFSKDRSIGVLPRTAAAGLTVMYSILSVNIALSTATSGSANIFSFLGAYSILTTHIITGCLFALLLLSLKTWLYIRIVGATIMIPTIVSGYFYYEMLRLFSCQDFDSSFHDRFMNLSDSLNYSGLATLLIAIATVVLTIIWMCRKQETD